MATEYLTGTSGDDYLDGGDGVNEYTGGEGNDYINGADGENTIYFNRRRHRQHQLRAQPHLSIPGLPGRGNARTQ